MKRIVLMAGAALVILEASLFSVRGEAGRVALHSATIPQPRGDIAWITRFEELNRRVKEGGVDLIFIGDSITHGFEIVGRQVWNEFYRKRRALNLGIAGDSTQHVLWRLDHGNIDGISPKLAVVLVGTNNATNNTPQEIADGVKAIVGKLREKLPATHVLVLGIFPRGADPWNHRRLVIQKANQLIFKLHHGEKVYYLDIGRKLLKNDGTVNRSIMPDFLHLSPDGYQIWAESIEPTVAMLLDEK